MAHVRRLSNDDLVHRLPRILSNERGTTAIFLAHLAEMDGRRLYRSEGYPSMFIWCTEVLHLSEHAAYNRIECARAARRFPIILSMVARGDVHLTAVRLLAPHLTPENHRAILAEARHQGRESIARIVARLRPLEDVPATIRRLPEGSAAPSTGEVRAPAASTGSGDLFAATPAEGCSAAIDSDNSNGTDAPGKALNAGVPAGDAGVPAADSGVPAAAPPPGPRGVVAPRAILAPLSPGRYRVQFTASQAAHDRLREAQALLRHQIPNGDPALVIEQALTLLVDVLKRRKSAVTGRPRAPRQTPRAAVRVTPTSRHIPAAVRHAVWERDDGRCTFRSRGGRTCGSRDGLEFHHAEPFAVGGSATVENIALRCRAHNAHEAERDFGVGKTRERRADRAPGGRARDTGPGGADIVREGPPPIGRPGSAPDGPGNFPTVRRSIPADLPYGPPPARSLQPPRPPANLRPLLRYHPASPGVLGPGIRPRKSIQRERSPTW